MESGILLDAAVEGLSAGRGLWVAVPDDARRGLNLLQRAPSLAGLQRIDFVLLAKGCQWVKGRNVDITGNGMSESRRVQDLASKVVEMGGYLCWCGVREV
jgi:hypothetical protein